MSYQVELIPISEGNRITIKENEKIIVGRGSSLGCNDKKISRQHAELLLKKDETLWIKPIHTNPLFYRPANGKTIQLTKDVEQELKDGDQIGLLPTNFFFRITFSNDINNSKDDVASESTKEDDKSRKLPEWMSTSTTDRPSVKRQLSSEDGNDQSKTSGDTDKPSVLKTFDSDDGDGFDSVSPKKVKSSNKPRPPCSYGATCYRKNPAHRSEQSHPGDSDYEDEKSTKDDDKKDNSDTDKPLCPYGKTCYRQNPQHKHDYRH